MAELLNALLDIVKVFSQAQVHVVALSILDTADAAIVRNWAWSRGISTLSFWALQRDNGSCPGTKGAGACSGIAQPTWYFSHAFEPFTR